MREDVFQTFSFNGRQIPGYMEDGLRRYVEDHKKPGDFLSAVISNDLYAACERADGTNVELLHVYVAFLYNEAPGNCWGSREQLDAWVGDK